MCRKFFPIYTKSFGGKIWKNLHSVSPGNKFGKKINGVLFERFSLTKNSKSDPTNFARQINKPSRKETSSNCQFCSNLQRNVRFSEVSFPRWFMFKQSKVTFSWLEYTLHAQNYGFQTYRRRSCFFSFLFDNTRLETLVCQVKVTLEISKRHGNSRQNFATEEETFLDCREN